MGTRDTPRELSGDWKNPLSIQCSGWYVCSMLMTCTCAIYSRHSTALLRHGPRGFSGSIGKRLVTRSEQCVSLFEPVQLTEQLSNVDPKELSTDQRYLMEICNSISIGECGVDLAMRNPGCLNHSRWLTTANRILRLYVSDKKTIRESEDAGDVHHSRICSNVVCHKSPLVMQRRS